jgi:hypothetical protein
METKQKIMSRVCSILRIPEFFVSRGSSEPREFLLEVANQVGLQSQATGLDKPGIGKLIVESNGEAWLPDYDSRGSTVTKDGLLAIERVVSKMLE